MAAAAIPRHASFLVLLLCLVSTTAFVLAARGVHNHKPSTAGGYNKKPVVKPPPVYPAPSTTYPGGKGPPVVYPAPGTNKPGGKAPPVVYPAPGTTYPGGKAPPVVYPAPGTGTGGAIPTIPGFTIPGMGGIGNGIPGLGGGWGGGYGGPAGGYSRGGVVVPSVVCSEKGPCYGRRVTCPKKCFSSYSGAGKGYGGGGGEGSCTVDCKVKCTAYC